MIEPDRFAQALADRYRIERELGAGGMATVYLAEDVKHRRKVAIKVLRPELSAVLGGERFLKEIELTASLQHSNILPLFDSGAAGGLLYYVMPYVEGETLRARLEREHQLPIPEAIRIASAVAAALDYAHRHGAVHRDIKPENILLSEESVLVADFGIALALRDAGGARLTETGLSLGTPQYMSPEQATAERVVDARTDIYSLGAVLYEMLAGEPPFTAATTQGIIAKLLTQPPVSLRLLRDTVSPGLEAAVEQALAKIPADRFSTCRDFSEAVASAPRMHAPSGGAMAAETRLVPLHRATRRRWIMSAAAALVVLAIASLAWAALRNRAPATALPLERVQLTFTGNAAVPGISHDGSKVAYRTRQCDTAGRCTFDIVVQDVGGAGTATVLRGALDVWLIRWTEDGRHLVFGGSMSAGEWGLFSMPSLGGKPRPLGCCTGSMGGGDTVLITALPRGTDTVAWVRWITAPDGAVQDSLALGLARSRVPWVDALARGQLLVSYARQQGTVSVVLTRSGLVTDSLLFNRPNEPAYSWITPDRSRVAYWFPHAGRAREYDLVLYRVDPKGRLEKPDTVYRQLTIGESGDYQAGIEVYDFGPPDYSVWALTRAEPLSMRWSQRRLAAATEHMSAFISNSGDRVAIGRSAATAPGKVQLSVIPFDSGPEVALGGAEDLVDWGWSRDDRSIIVAARRGADSVAILQLDAATGRSQRLATVASNDFRGAAPVRGGGMVVLYGDEFRRVGIAALADSAFPLPRQWTQFMSVSPDGEAFVTLGWNLSADTILVHRISVVDGTAIKLASLVATGARPPQWLADGNVIIPVMETAETMAWYSVPSNGGAATRLGTPPRYPADYAISTDGRRAVARVEDPRTDIYMIRNFGELLRLK